MPADFNGTWEMENVENAELMHKMMKEDFPEMEKPAGKPQMTVTQDGDSITMISSVFKKECKVTVGQETSWTLGNHTFKGKCNWEGDKLVGEHEMDGGKRKVKETHWLEGGKLIKDKSERKRCVGLRTAMMSFI